VRVRVHDLSQAPAADLVGGILDQLTTHPGWGNAAAVPFRRSGVACPILENRRRLMEGKEAETLRRRLAALIEISEQRGGRSNGSELFAVDQPITGGACSPLPI
jgi:hypothetical protein